MEAWDKYIGSSRRGGMRAKSHREAVRVFNGYDGELIRNNNKDY